ncbi:RNA-guided endonuclease TnpB family protein [Lactobacillus sp. LL6]|uniref:RNA-guided endonuclease TnpB family protein n=1 Tax=Lactobacillus sp. LL6 TaxID=2596827 RepID=UPI0011860514|nr:RNA-guided endonuclease TnpB family protein [Lactobacillus sp. LL6]TSO26337.1 IS200/IS605 family element transposase accessory protein TnpB [Lactobacillus sp. LL6]
MLAGIKLRLYPNKKQQGQLFQMFGNDRFIWNQMLAMMNERYKNNHHLPFLGKYKLDILLKPLKHQYSFLKNSDSSSLQIVNANLNQAWKNFFDKSIRARKPKFHSRKSTKNSYTGKSTVRVIGRRYLKLPKLGYIKTSKTGLLKDAKIKRYTVSLEPTGKYYISFQVEVEKKELPKTNKEVGIDIGLADLAILSNGIKYDTFDGSYFDKKATEWQKKFSRRRHLAQRLVLQDKNKKVLNPRNLESFSNWQKAKIVKARYQNKVKNQRKDYLHKVTTELVKNYDVIAIEDLKAKNLQKNHHLAKSISNASWRMFRMMLEYKCEWYGKKLIIVNPKNTSRICSNCGFNSGEKPLNIREWTCQKCKVHHDRDINAAVNILNKAKLTG